MNIATILKTIVFSLMAYLALYLLIFTSEFQEVELYHLDTFT